MICLGVCVCVTFYEYLNLNLAWDPLNYLVIWIGICLYFWRFPATVCKFSLTLRSLVLLRFLLCIYWVIWYCPAVRWLLIFFSTLFSLRVRLGSFLSYLQDPSFLPWLCWNNQRYSSFLSKCLFVSNISIILLEFPPLCWNSTSTYPYCPPCPLADLKH